MAKKRKKKSRTRPARRSEDVIVESLIETINESKLLPWQKPWNCLGLLPANFEKMKEYRGINILLLSLAGYECPYWVTFKQAHAVAAKQARKAGRKISLFIPDVDEDIYELDGEGYWCDKKTGDRYTPKGSYWRDENTGERWYGGVKKGERGRPVVFWKWLNKTGADGKPEFDGKGKPKQIPFMRHYTVFNLDQCDGIEWDRPKLKKHQGIPAAEKLVASMPNPPKIEGGGSAAWYKPSADLVKMPDKGRFKTVEAYYSTLLHELGHSTGHQSRLDRKSLTDATYFGSHLYSQEELIAELTAVFLCAHVGIEKAVIDNSAAYLKHWIGAIKENPKVLISSAQAAQRASDYIRDAQLEKEEAA
jgi:antirestriction protein ArdC